MATKSLFETNEAYTDKAVELSDELRAFLFPFFCKWTKVGFSPRAILAIAVHEISAAELEALFNLEELGGKAKR